MNQTNSVQNQYQQIAVETASPERLLIMMYDGALRFLKLALKDLNSKNFEGSHFNLVKTQNILDELIISLNMEYEVSHNLRALYKFFNERLVQANVEKNAAKIEEVFEFLTELRQTWGQVAAQHKKAIG